MAAASLFNSWESSEGSSLPLGVTYVKEEDAYNFSIYSKHASSVTLLLYTEHDQVQPLLVYEFDPLINKSHRIWHCRIPLSRVSQARFYAYRVDGPLPEGRSTWHNFDKEKILLDPYAKAVFFPPGFDRNQACLAGCNDGKAPLGILLKDLPFDWQQDHFPRHEHDLVIYELHTRGFTKHDSSGIKTSLQGTFAGIVEKIPYLLELGITAVELLPVYQTDPQNGDYWGYTPLNFFSPIYNYASSGELAAQINEFRFMVRELHKANIEVILDVVYNHTTEGNSEGPMYSFKGIDNSTYYLINEDLRDPYYNYSGTGNTLHTRNSYVRRMILDSLRYWRKEMHVDGFRFDLATIFSRNTDGSLSFEEPPIFGMIGSDPDLSNARLIAEPWDAAGTMQLGKKFPGIVWMQWNSLFRDDIRRFVRGDEGMVDDLMSRLYGSEDLFSDDPKEAYHAYQSINYVNCHDGFTLYDLVSYQHKHNHANGHDDTDGVNENFSWNGGVEGDEQLTDSILSLRMQQAKNFCVLLFISNGTPMFVAGDEFLRTQMGNNNPYNQDNTTSWINWNRKNEFNDFFTFFKKMIAFRKDHPSIARSRFWRKDIKWFNPVGAMRFDYYSKSLSFFLDGHSQKDAGIYVMINAHENPVDFIFQEEGPWHRVIDTSLGAGDDFLEEGKEILQQSGYRLEGRSVAVFIRPVDHAN